MKGQKYEDCTVMSVVHHEYGRKGILITSGEIWD